MAAKKAASASTPKAKSTARKATPAVRKSAKPVSIPAAAAAAPKKKTSAKSAPAAAVASAVAAPLTTEEISLRAFQIWEAKGKPDGQDLLNWQEAEAQLKAERGL